MVYDFLREIYFLWLLEGILEFELRNLVFSFGFVIRRFWLNFINLFVFYFFYLVKSDLKLKKRLFVLFILRIYCKYVLKSRCFSWFLFSWLFIVFWFFYLDRLFEVFLFFFFKGGSVINFVYIKIIWFDMIE